MTLALAEQESCFEMDRRRGPSTATAPGARGSSQRPDSFQI